MDLSNRSLWMQRLCDWILRYGTGRSNQEYRAAIKYAVIVMAGITIVMFSFGAPVMSGRAWDVPVLLDGAWRIVNGQVPHNDFFSHIGSLPFYLVAAGIKLIGPSIMSIVCGSTILMFTLVTVSAILCHGRTTAWVLLVTTCYIGMLVVTPRPLGDPPFLNDFAMLYNRMGEAMIFLVSLGLFLPLRQPTPMRYAFDVFLQAALLVSLLFIKLNYFVVGMGLVFCAALFGSLPWKKAAMLIATVLILVGLSFWATGISPSAMRGDFHIMAGAQDIRLKLAQLCLATAKAAPSMMFILLAMVVRWLWNSDLSRKDFINEGCITAALIGGGLLLFASNCQRNEVPLFGVAAIVLGDLTLRRLESGRLEPTRYAPQVILVCLLMMALIMPTLMADIQATQNTVVNGLRWPKQNAALKDTHLKDFRFSPKGERATDCQQYESALADGLALLQSNRTAAGRTMAVMFSNPFDFALGWPPAKGGSICFAPNVINERSHPPLKSILRASQFVFTAKDQSEFRNIYGAELASYEVSIAAESKYYVLLKLSLKSGTR